MTTPDRDEEVARFDGLQARLDEAKQLPTTIRRMSEATAVLRFCTVRLSEARSGREPLYADLMIAYDRLAAHAKTARKNYEDQLLKESRKAFDWKY